MTVPNHLFKMTIDDDGEVIELGTKTKGRGNDEGKRINIHA